MGALTIQEARRAVMAAHPEWRSADVEHAAQGMLVTEARLAAQDALTAQVEALQASADAQNAEARTAGLSGHVGGAASVWDALRGDREDAQWADLAARADAEAARVAEQVSEEAKPAGWRY